MVVPITYKSGKLGKLLWNENTPESEKSPKIENILDVRESLLSYKDPSGKIQTEIVQIIPSKEYKNLKKENVSKEDFSGWVMVFSWEEEFITGFELKDGRKVRDLEKPTNSRGRRTSCSMYIGSSNVVSYCYPCSNDGSTCTMCDIYIQNNYIVTCSMPSSDSGSNGGGINYGGGYYFDPYTYLNINLNTASAYEISFSIAMLFESLTDAEKTLMGYGTSNYEENLRKYYKDARDAIYKTRDRFGMNAALYDATGRANAYKHALLAAYHARASSFGRTLAEQLTDAHEGPLPTPPNQNLEMEMDYWNNDQGFAVFDSNTSASDDWYSDNVWIRFQNGQLRFLDNNVLTPTP